MFIDTPIEVCEQRDPKGFYKKAREGDIKNFTGISSPYEIPKEAQIHIKTENSSIEECGKKIVDYLIKYDYINNIK